MYSVDTILNQADSIFHVCFATNY